MKNNLQFFKHNSQKINQQIIINLKMFINKIQHKIMYNNMRGRVRNLNNREFISKKITMMMIFIQNIKNIEINLIKIQNKNLNKFMKKEILKLIIEIIKTQINSKKIYYKNIKKIDNIL